MPPELREPSAPRARCPTCGSDLPAGAKFCPECGTAQVSATRASTARRDRAPRDYTPPHLADRILRTKSALEGERKHVTVLFADIKHSMNLAEKLDPEEWHRLMDEFFDILTTGVHRFEGTVNQYTGDGIMALFGAPIAHEDHAFRACYAALHLSDQLLRFAEGVSQEQGIELSTRLGLSSGPVVVGKIGDDLRMDYTAQGHTVGLAARLEALAEPGRPLLSEATARQVQGFFELEERGALELRGASEPVEAFHARLGSAAPRNRFDLVRRRGLARTVGRETEMSTLVAALEKSLAGHGQAVGIVAEAGVGKSHLCAAFAERCLESGLPVYEARGLATSVARSTAANDRASA